MFIKVDLPDPLAPINATNSPRAISNETPRTAWTSTSPVRYVFSTSSRRTATLGLESGIDHGRRGPLPNGLVAGVDVAPLLSIMPVTTRSPSFNPSTTSVATPSLIPVLIVTLVGCDAVGGEI